MTDLPAGRLDAGPGCLFDVFTPCMNTDFDCLWQMVTAQFHAQGYSVHGPDH